MFYGLQALTTSVHFQLLSTHCHVSHSLQYVFNKISIPECPHFFGVEFIRNLTEIVYTL